MKQTLKLWMLAAILVISSLAANAEELGERAHRGTGVL